MPSEICQKIVSLDLITSLSALKLLFFSVYSKTVWCYIIGLKLSRNILSIMSLVAHSFQMWVIFKVKYTLLVHLKRKYTLLKICTLLKIDNNSPWVNLTHFLEKTHLRTLELIFISWSWRVCMHVKFYR